MPPPDPDLPATPVLRGMLERQVRSGRPVATRRSVQEVLDDLAAAEEEFVETAAAQQLPDAVADRLPPRVRLLVGLAGRFGITWPAVAGVLVVVGVVAVVAGVVLWRNWPAGEPTEFVADRAVVTAPVASTLVTEAPAPDPAADADGTAPEVVVHITGQVLAPGLVTLPAGARVADAVRAAGGVTDGADTDLLNLARPLVDGEQVRVPAVGEVVPEPVAAPAPAGNAAEVPGTPGTGLVDVNTATTAELDALPGIGEVLAGRIVAWRTEHGNFADVDELGEVQGIGPKVLAELRDLVTV